VIVAAAGIAASVAADRLAADGVAAVVVAVAVAAVVAAGYAVADVVAPERLWPRRPWLVAARSPRRRLRWTASRPATGPVWSAPRSPRWAARRTSECACRTPTWPDTSAASGNPPGTASTCCTTFRAERFRWRLRCRELKRKRLLTKRTYAHHRNNKHVILYNIYTIKRGGRYELNFKKN